MKVCIHIVGITKKVDLQSDLRQLDARSRLLISSDTKQQGQWQVLV